MNSAAADHTDSRDFGFLPGGSKMTMFVQAFDWSTTPLGPIEDWPYSLRVTVGVALRSILPMAILVGETGIMIYNDAYAQFSGDKHPRLLGRSVLDGWPEAADFNRNILTEVLAGDSLHYSDMRMELARGNGLKEVWMNLDYSPVCNDAGEPLAVLAVVVETTDRMLAVRKQQNAEAIANAEREKMEHMFNNAPACVAVLHGPDHVYTLANPLYKKIVGNRDIVGKTLRDALPEIKDTGLFEIMDDVYKTGAPYVGNEVPIGLDRHDNGVIEPGFFNFVYQPVLDEHGTVTDIFIHAVEVTDQVRAKESLTEATLMFEALFNSTVVAMALVTMKGKVLKANTRLLQLFGYSEKDLARGLTSEKLSAPGHAAVSKIIYDSLRLTGAAEPITKRYKRKDGSEFPGLVGAAMLPNSEDQFMAFILDMSETEKLKKLNQVKDEFVALASHQLRTPATSVKQYIGILIEGYFGELTAEQKKYLEVANSANDRQLHIIDDLLKTAQIDTDGYELQIDTVDLLALTRDIAGHFTDAAKSKGQTLTVSCKTPTLMAHIDRAEITIALSNIIENAYKYSAADTAITITLSTKGHCAELAITDQGVGISKADQAKIFDKFTRVDNDLSDTVNGNGLGLYWVKRIVALHNGSIVVASKPGVGTTFTVRLPL